MSLPSRTLFLVLAALFPAGCSPAGTGGSGGGSGDRGPDAPGDPAETTTLFDADHVISVEIQIDANDWGRLRQEGRSLVEATAGCEDPTFSFTCFTATITVDGLELEQVAVQKKGFLGSLSVNRPSLKLNFGKYVPGRTLAGSKRMTLNNDRQDRSHTHQCMSYDLFRAAGLAAPRCSFARVIVNGEDLGIYSHVEAVKKPFLARNFSSDAGNLYEANAGADFHPALIDRYERKTNETSAGGGPPDRSDLDQVAQALEANDDGLYDALSQVIDMDQFLSFWAMEVIAGHWDGYSGDRNNHYLYRDPTTERFSLIPWGTDGTFTDDHPFLGALPASVYAWGAIANRLYDYPPTRESYRQRLGELLDATWDEEALLAEVDRIGTLTSADATALEMQRTFIGQRGEEIRNELASAAPAWPHDLSLSIRQCQDFAAISGTFAASWGSAGDLQASPTSSLDFELGGVTPSIISYHSAAGFEEEQTNHLGSPTVNIYGATGLTSGYLVVLVAAAPQFTVGEVSFHGFETFGYLVRVFSGSYTVLGYIGAGTVVFDQADTTPGAPVTGIFSGLLVDGL